MYINVLQVLVCVTVVTCVQQEEDLSDLIMKVIKQGLEGLVLKDTKVGVSIVTTTTEPSAEFNQPDRIVISVVHRSNTLYVSCT